MSEHTLINVGHFNKAQTLQLWSREKFARHS